MGKSLRTAIFVFLLLWGMWGVYAPPHILYGTADPGREVVVIPVQGQIDPGTFSFVERALDEARNRNAAVVVELDTPGGYIDSAVSIGASIKGYPGRVLAFVNNEAISAGAYLALCADEIYMVPGAAMGAAEPVQLGGGEAGEKVLSYWEGKMRSAVEGERDEEIAAAMVRREIYIEGLVERGELLTLTARKALENNYSEGTVDSLEEMLKEANLEGARLHFEEKALVDSFISWVTNPVVATILLALGIGGLVLEIATAGFGLAGAVSLVSFGIYFSSHVIGGLAGYEVILLFVLGVALMMVEAFIPGFGIFGIGGLLVTLVSIVLAAASTEAGLKMLLAALLLAGIFLFFMLRFLARRGFLRKFILEDTEKKESGYVAPLDYRHLVGKRGKTVTPLRPAGTAIIEDKRIDVVSEGDFIERDAEITVVEVGSTRVVVRRLNQD